MAATATLREIVHNLEPTTAARTGGTPATEVGTAEGATRVRIVEVETV
jgi:UDP-N-acetylglucosamine:LPS N-acetylglucosamine transferase